MPARCADLLQAQIIGVDGPLGRLHDVFIDLRSWTISCFVLQIGRWIRRRQVLLDPRTVMLTNEPAASVAVRLTRAQARQRLPREGHHPALPIPTDERLGESEEWAGYWEGPHVVISYSIAAESPTVVEMDRAATWAARHAPLPCLRRFTALRRMPVDAIDGPLGRLQDLFLHPTQWKIDHLLVETDATPPRPAAQIEPAAVRGVKQLPARLRLNRMRAELLHPTEPVMPHLLSSPSTDEWADSIGTGA